VAILFPVLASVSQTRTPRPMLGYTIEHKNLTRKAKILLDSGTVKA